MARDDRLAHVQDFAERLAGAVVGIGADEAQEDFGEFVLLGFGQMRGGGEGLFEKIGHSGFPCEGFGPAPTGRAQPSIYPTADRPPAAPVRTRPAT